VPSLRSFAEVPWLQPYPDRWLDEVAPSEDEPDAVVVAHETIELAIAPLLHEGLTGPGEWRLPPTRATKYPGYSTGCSDHTQREPEWEREFRGFVKTGDLPAGDRPARQRPRQRHARRVGHTAVLRGRQRRGDRPAGRR
jgi:hypothetical protein